MTATDANGLSTSKIVNILPRKSRDQPRRPHRPAWADHVDGVPVSTPRTFTGVEGFQREVCGAEHRGRRRTAPRSSSPAGRTARASATSSRRRRTTPPTRRRTSPSQPFTGQVLRQHDVLGSPGAHPAGPEHQLRLGRGLARPGAARRRLRGALDEDPVVRRRPVQVHRRRRRRRPALHRRKAGHRPVARPGEHASSATSPSSARACTRSRWTTSSTAAAPRRRSAGTACTDQPSDTYRARVLERAARASQRDSRAPRPTLVRDEDAIDHDWGEGSPGAGIGANRFVARWTRTMSFAPGDYEFAVTADDGVRLYVDGVRVIDKWIDQAPTTYRTTLPLDGGPHKIVMEYYENGGGAMARLELRRGRRSTRRRPRTARSTGTRRTPRACPASRPDRPTSCATTRRSTSTGARDRAGDRDRGRTGSWRAGRGRWCSRPASTASPAARDDGMRVYVDNVPVVDRWTSATASTASTRSCTGGPHELRVEYFEAGGGARAEFTYERIGDVVPADGGCAAEYFANRNLQGSPVLTRTDDAIDFDWGVGTPGDGVPADNFSARWTKSVTLDEGNYKFTRDRRRRRSACTSTASACSTSGSAQARPPTPSTRALAQGTHEIVLEYFEAGWDAVAKLALRADHRAASATAAAARAVQRGVLRQQRSHRRSGADPHGRRRSTSTGARALPASRSRPTASRRAGRGPRPTPPAPTGSA